MPLHVRSVFSTLRYLAVPSHPLETLVGNRRATGGCLPRTGAKEADAASFGSPESEAYSFTHNHGSVENYPKSKETNIGDTLLHSCSTSMIIWRYTKFPLNHDYGRKG